MGLKRATGNMYDWVTHTHSHLAGKCPHECSYCYVQAMAKRFSMDRYSGPVRLVESELAVNYGAGRTIFVEHMNDLFAEPVETDWIGAVVDHCHRYPGNTYVFQTKAPARMALWWNRLPADVILGTTIEATGHVSGTAPHPDWRIDGMKALGKLRPDDARFVTIEPIQEPLDVAQMLGWLADIRPDFVNIGADSKGHGLNEPAAAKVVDLLSGIQRLGIELRQKRNLARLLNR